MGICLLQEGKMVKSSFSMSAQERAPQISSWAARFKISRSPRMASGLQQLRKAPPVLLSSTYGRRARLPRQRCWRLEARWTAFGGITLGSTWPLRAHGDSPFRNTPRAPSRGQTSLALLCQPQRLRGVRRRRAWSQSTLKGR